MEITPAFNKTGIPLYMQLYQYIKTGIEEKRLEEGSRLPSIRTLAAHLQVSKTTVENAYQQLLAEGYIVSKMKSGMFVQQLDLDISHEKVDKAKTEVHTQKAAPRILYDFQYGNIDPNEFPLHAWKKAIRDYIDLQEDELFTYGDNQGSAALRREICDYLFRSRGIECHHDQIVITAGTQSSIDMICHLLDMNEREAAIENPGYNGVRAVFHQHACKLMPIPVQEDGIKIDELWKTLARLVYVTPSHQFPTGGIMPIQKRLSLLKWAEQKSAYIIEDDYDSEFRYEGQPIPALKSLDKGDRVIYCGTFSKSFLPAARLSYVVLPHTLMNDYQSKFGIYNQAVSPIIQGAMVQFMKNGDFYRHLRKVKVSYQKKYQLLIRLLTSHFGDKAEIIGHKAGLHLLLELKGRDAHQLISEAEAAGVQVYSTKHFWMDENGAPASQILLGFGALTEKQLEEGIRILRNCWFG